MSKHFSLRTGILFFAIALLAIGITHLVTQNFPTGLLPVPATFPGRTILVYISGLSIIVASIWMLVKPNNYKASQVMLIILGVLWLIIHLPKLLSEISNGGTWSAALEVLALCSGALLLTGINRQDRRLIKIAVYVLAFVWLAFAVLHFIYVSFIVFLIPAWLPFKLFFAWLVMVAFLAAGVSWAINRWVRLSATLLSAMFFLWFLILHLPRVISNVRVEAEWTSLFVALAMTGITLMVSGSQRETQE